MKIDLFEMERTQVRYENLVDYNLSESGVLPVELRELTGADPGWLLATKLAYPHGNGSPELRERVAAFYGASPENITITNGSSEANLISFWGLLQKGDRAAIQIPNYLQTRGLSRFFTGKADEYLLVRTQQGRWALDADSFRKAINKRTRVILVTNPNNPTGAVLNQQEMDLVIDAADRVNAWIVSDEVYRGAELNGSEISPTFWGKYSKVLVVSGLSKAFGMPGLRIGWIVGPPRQIEKLEMYRDYITLTPNMVSDRVAAIAMQPHMREHLLQRTRKILQTQFPILNQWVNSHTQLNFTPPVAGAIAYIRYDLPCSSRRLFDRLRTEKSVLITPAAHFGSKEKYFRVGYGYNPEKLKKGLTRISELLNSFPSKKST